MSTLLTHRHPWYALPWQREFLGRSEVEGATLESMAWRAGIVALSVAVLSILHFTVSIGTHSLHVYHVIFRSLYLLPIVAAAVWFFVPGAALTALVVSIIYGIHIATSWAGDPMENATQIAMIAVYWLAAIIVGILSFLEARQRHDARDMERREQLDTIFRLTNATEYRDEDTGRHIQRMSHIAAAVSHAMGLEEDASERILYASPILLYASPMHDVGKIGIPDRILLKPGKLNADEWEIMKRHTDIGARILAGSSSRFLQEAEAIAATHHEKWDGSGYPEGLKGEEIPLCGRIVAISDVFDALMSKRPYKPAFSFDESIRMIEQGRGSHFDPTVVDAFLAIKDEILSIHEQFSDDGESVLIQDQEHE